MRAVIAGVSGGLLLAGVARAGDFEGIIILNELNDGGTVQQQWFLKGDRLRFEETGPDAEKEAMIFDATKKVMFSLRHDDKIYLEVSTAEHSKATPDDVDDIVVMKAGSTDKAVGYTCEIYGARNKSDGSAGEVCMARGISSAALSGMMSAQAGGLAATSLNAGNVRGRRFSGQGCGLPPADYKKQDMAIITPESGSDSKPGLSTEVGRAAQDPMKEGDGAFPLLTRFFEERR